MQENKTLVVNLYGGPGTGKSTTAAGIFYDLKTSGINCEIVSEFAKDLTWEKRYHTLEDQIYIFAKQYHRIFRLLGQVEVIVTDSPILLSLVYDKKKCPHLRNLILQEYNKMWTYNVFLKRKKKYNPKGRNQTESQAKDLDVNILDVLTDTNQLYETFDGDTNGKNLIVSKIFKLLNK